MGQHSKPGRHSKSASKDIVKRSASRTVSGYRPMGYESADVQAALEEKTRQSRRSRIKLIVLIAVIFLILAAAVFFGIKYLNSRGGSEVDKSSENMSQLIDGTVDDSSAKLDTSACTTIPALLSFKGSSIDSVKTVLGDLVMYSETSETQDESDPAIKQICEIKIAPVGSAASEYGSGAATLYLSLDESAKVLQVYYVASLGALGSTERSYAKLIADASFFQKCMADAGVNVPNDSFPLPDASSYEIYAPNASGEQCLSRCSHTWSGSTSGDSPATWELCVSFDYNLTASVTTVSNRLLSVNIH